MKCPYCGNDDPEKFLYPDDDDGPYVICLACNGEFEEGEIEYYEAQSEEGEAEEGKLVSLNIITQLLDQEIEWSKENREQVPDSEADWFIKGLEQAKYLILELSKLDSLDDLSSLEPKVNLPKGAPGYMGDYGGIPHGPFDL